MIANPHELYLPGLESVSYPPKKINTVAVKVTPENIGALSLEFETELCYFNTGAPFFEIEVSRGTETDPKPNRFIQARIGDWLVVLWDEYHLFRENEFKNTFQVNSANVHELSVDHSSIPEFTEEDLQRNYVAPPTQGDFASGGRGLMNPTAVQDLGQP